MRKSFLSQWKPYPCISDLDDSYIFGQLILLIKDSNKIKINSDLKIKEYLLKTDSFKVEGFSAFDVFQPGDKVAIQVDDQQLINKIVLLAPNLKNDFKVLKRSVLGWYEFLQKVRQFFLNHNFLETPTPTLVINPGMEPHLQAFKTQWSFGECQLDLYLPTSPEIHLKKLLSQGVERLFEIKSCFRNEELSPIHSPEFKMLEWYRAYADLNHIESDIQKLLSHLTGQSVELNRVHLRDFYEDHFNADWSEVFDFNKLKIRAAKQGFESKDMTWNDLFSWFQVSIVEPELKKIKSPTLLYGFPSLQPSLARNKQGESERFELYWNGLELANAYHELNDPDEQQRRWLQDQEFRRQNGLEVYEFDHEFIDSLYQGLPPSAGIALGLDRLYMAINKIKSIEELSAFKKIKT